jgi:hypothetical protein
MYLEASTGTDSDGITEDRFITVAELYLQENGHQRLRTLSKYLNNKPADDERFDTLSRGDSLSSKSVLRLFNQRRNENAQACTVSCRSLKGLLADLGLDWEDVDVRSVMHSLDQARLSSLLGSNIQAYFSV